MFQRGGHSGQAYDALRARVEAHPIPGRDSDRGRELGPTEFDIAVTQALYAGKAQSGLRQAAMYELRERLDPYIRKSSPLSVPVRKPKATWVEPVVQAEIEYSAITADKLLRAPVFKGIRDDLSDERGASERTPQGRAPRRSRCG